jgi:hypothetical protein
MKDKPHITVNMVEFETLKIDDISSLIDLIDNCVQEANDYISDLTGRVGVLQEECEELKRLNRKQDEQS